MNKVPELLAMLKAGVHFGHQKSRRHPKMAPYIFTVRNGVCVFDLEATQVELEKTLESVKNLAAQGKVVLFVGTKKQAKEIVKSAAEACGMPYLVEKWIGGLLTNFPEVKKRLRNLAELKEQFKTGEIEKYTKKEQLVLKKKMDKMEKYLAGLAGIEKKPDVLYVASVHAEKTAIIEAKRTNTQIVGVCDTNCNPSNVDYLVPANDDAVNSIKMVAELISAAISEGKAMWEKKQAEMPKPVERKTVKRVVRNSETKDESI